MSARPMASIACSPPDMVAAFWRRRSPSRGNSEKTWSRRAARSRAVHSTKAPMRRFSSTVIRGKTRRPSGTTAMPRATI